MSTSVAGKNARIAIGASPTYLSNVSWEITDSGDVIDDTGTEDGGWQHAITGTRVATWRVDAFWDSAANQHASPLSISFGATMQTCKQYVNAAPSTGAITTGKYWDLGTVLITEVRENSEVKGGVKLTFTARTQGSYAPPA